jgi:hypothetical protein
MARENAAAHLFDEWARIGTLDFEHASEVVRAD